MVTETVYIFGHILTSKVHLLTVASPRWNGWVRAPHFCSDLSWDLCKSLRSVLCIGGGSHAWILLFFTAHQQPKIFWTPHFFWAGYATTSSLSIFTATSKTCVLWHNLQHRSTMILQFLFKHIKWISLITDCCWLFTGELIIKWSSTKMYLSNIYIIQWAFRWNNI